MSSRAVTRAGAFRQLLAEESSSHRIWVATHGDAVVGMTIWSPSRDDATESTADLEAIYLDPDFIGKGPGRTLMQRVVEDALRRIDPRPGREVPAGPCRSR